MASFDEVSSWVPGPDGTWRGTVPPDWMQGRAAFGGLVTAAALRALRTVVDADRPLRSVTTRFLAPVGPEEATLTATPLRAGRALTQAQAVVSQGGRPCAFVDAAYGASRPSALVVEGPPCPPGRVPAVAAAGLPYMPGITPAFVQHVAMVWTEGQPPFSGASEAHIGGWCRFREAARGVEGLVGLLDAWPAPVLPLLRRPCPASTVSWTAHLVGPVPEGQPWMRYQSVTNAAADGYTSMQARLWGPDGRLVAWLEQLVVVFDG